MQLGYSGTLRPNRLRTRLSSRPLRGMQFAVVCPKCRFRWYFRSDWEVFECGSQHEHRDAAVFVYSFVPTKRSLSGMTLHEHIWVELVDSGEIKLRVVG